MKNKKDTNIVDEAIADINVILEATKKNTKEILRSTMREEIDEIVKGHLLESNGYLEEEIEDENLEDVESTETDIEDLEKPEDEIETTDDEDLDTPAVDEPDMDLEIPAVDDETIGIEPEMDFDEMDLTSASDETVLNVFKKLTGEDEIEVVSDNEVKITEPETGTEYVVKTGDETEAPELDGGDEDLFEEKIYEITISEDIIRDAFSDRNVKETPAPNTGDIDGQTSPVDTKNHGDNLQGGFTEEDPNPEKDAHAEHVMTEGVILEYDECDAGMVDEATGDPFFDDFEMDVHTDPETGERYVGGETAEFEESPLDKDFKYTGEKHHNFGKPYTDASQNRKNKPTDNKITKTPKPTGIDIDDDLLDGVDLSNPYDLEETMVLPGQKSNVNPDFNRTIQPGRGELYESVSKNKYNELLEVAKKMQTENKQFKDALGRFQKMLAETVVYNTNLTYMVKLITENSTTKEEKQSIMERFDNVKDLKESKRLYKTIGGELKNKKPLMESSLEKRLIDTKTSGHTTKLSESTVYVDPSTEKIKDLIRKVERF